MSRLHPEPRSLPSERSSAIDVLDAILTHLHKLGLPIATSLRPGRTRDEIESLFDAAGIVPPIELVDLYEWRDGSTRYPGHVFLPGYYFLSTEDAFTEYTELRRATVEAEGFDVSPLLWPVFASIGDDYQMSLCGRFSVPTSPVYTFFTDSGLPPLKDFESLSQMLEVSLECFRQGAFYAQGNALKKHVEQYLKIVEQLMPDRPLD